MRPRSSALQPRSFILHVGRLNSPVQGEHFLQEGSELVPACMVGLRYLPNSPVEKLLYVCLLHLTVPRLANEDQEIFLANQQDYAVFLRRNSLDMLVVV